MIAGIVDAVRRRLRLDRHELWPAVALTAHCLCVVGYFMVGRSARDALFLERAPASWLPWMYLASALGVTLVGLAYGRVADSFRRARSAAASALLLAAVTLGTWALLAFGHAGVWLVAALYVLVEIAGALAVLQLWMLANDAYNPREARRIFPIVVMGGIFANIGCGAVVTGLARRFGTESLLLFCVLLLGGAAALALVEGKLLPLPPGSARRVSRGPLSHAEREVVEHERAALWRDQHLRSIAQLLVVTFLATTLVDYQFKLSARAAFGGRSLAAFFGSYYAITGLLALGVQVLVTRRLLERLGLTAALAVLPLGLALGAAGFLFTASLWAVSVAQGSNVTFRYTINDSSVQLLYLPLPARQRALAKAWVEGIGKPGAIAAAAAFLIVYQRLGGSLRLLSLVVLALVAAWAFLLWRTRGSYVSTLERTLRRRQLDLASVRLHAEGDAAGVLRRALTSTDPREVEHALGLLPHVEALPEAEELLVSLLAHPAASIRCLAVEQIAARRGLHHGNLIYQLFEDPDPSVRAQAIRAFCGMAREKAVRSVRPFLGAPEVEVRSAAIAGLTQHGGLDGILTAGPALKDLLRGRTPEERRWGARALGDIGVRTFYQPLLELLGDPDPRVRQAALQAAARLRSPELVPALIYRLGEPATAADAADALAAIGSAEPEPQRTDLAGAWSRRPEEGGGERLEGTLEKVLRNPLEEALVRSNVPRVLVRLGTPQAARVLCRALDLREEPLRTQVVTSLARLTRQRPALPIDTAVVGRALDLEIALARRCLACAEALGLPEHPERTVAPSSAAGATALLAGALDDQRRRALERVLLLLGLVQPRIGAQGLRPELLEAGAGDPRLLQRRAAALELLDNLLPRGLRARVLPLWEGATRAERLQALEDAAEPPQAPSAWLLELTADPSPWVQACALCYLGHLGDPAHAPLAERALRSDHPRVREAGLLALARIAGPPPRTTLEPLLADADGGVRAAAAAAGRTAADDRGSLIELASRRRA
ncbi:MAG TPA: Npt1/Npt2 family nucleotide transporter [Myxococcales bacterium]|nr:Npt1/Npt2 family nucleotide transporter [Myxococcales bacterium]